MADVIKMILDGAVSDTASALFNKDKEKEIVMFAEIENSHDLYKLLMQMVDEGRLCEAEDTLYKELDKGFTKGKYLAGVELYEAMKALEPDYLSAHNFPLEEVHDGLDALERLKNQHSQTPENISID